MKEIIHIYKKFEYQEDTFQSAAFFDKQHKTKTCKYYMAVACQVIND